MEKNAADCLIVPGPASFASIFYSTCPSAGWPAFLRAAWGVLQKDLHILVGALILQQLHDLTDAAAVEAAAFNIGWHYALDIRAELDAYLCERTLRNYRRLLVDQGLDQILFRTLTDQLIKDIGVDTRKQRLDSTATRSAMRGLTRLGIIVESIRKFLRELRRVTPPLHAKIDAELVRKYVDHEGNGCFASTKPSESKRRLSEAAVDLLVPVNQFRVADGAPGAIQTREAEAALRRLAAHDTKP